VSTLRMRLEPFEKRSDVHFDVHVARSLRFRLLRALAPLRFSIGLLRNGQQVNCSSTCRCSSNLTLTISATLMARSFMDWSTRFDGHDRWQDVYKVGTIWRGDEGLLAPDDANHVL